MESDIIISTHHKPDNIKDVIYEVRGQKVMLDTDLAEMYEVEVSQLKRQVRRNIDRFPKDFMFELTPEEVSSLRCQNGILKTGRGQHSKYAPFAITEVLRLLLELLIPGTRHLKVLQNHFRLQQKS